MLPEKWYDKSIWLNTRYIHEYTIPVLCHSTCIGGNVSGQCVK